MYPYIILTYFVGLLVLIALLRLQFGNIKSEYSEENPLLINLCKFCPECKLRIRPDTEHCFECDACVEGFDHHCGFVGVCVGDNNAKYFSQFIMFGGIQVGLIGLSHLKFLNLIVDEKLKL